MTIEDLHAASTSRSIESAKSAMMTDGQLAAVVEARVQAELTAVTSEDKDDFLAALIEHGNIAKACRSAGISRMTAHRMKHSDPEFAWKWAEIMEAWVDDVEATLLQQCLDPSSANTIARFFYLKAHRAKYRDSVQQAQPAAAPKVHVIVELNRREGSRLDAVDAELVADVPEGDDE